MAPYFKLSFENIFFSYIFNSVANIDLYGRVAQATLVDSYSPPLECSPESPISSESNATTYP